MTDNVPDVLEQHIRGLYRAFNERDIEAVLSGLREDVVWANGMEGGHVRGRDGVRDYWTRQFREVRSTVEPQRIEPAIDGRVAVAVHQVVRSANGAQLLADTAVRHLFSFTDGLVSRFDIE